jgi:hypothetical protein
VRKLNDNHYSPLQVILILQKISNVKKHNTPLTPPPTEDIYAIEKQEQGIDPENINSSKEPNEIPGLLNEKDFDEDVSGDDLDVPGSELDDELEAIGNEDEENNYYSIGGDNHNELDEEQGN